MGHKGFWLRLYRVELNEVDTCCVLERLLFLVWFVAPMSFITFRWDVITTWPWYIGRLLCFAFTMMILGMAILYLNRPTETYFFMHIGQLAIGVGVGVPFAMLMVLLDKLSR